MSEDARCCGSGTCIIDAEGRCWCGQQWDGEKMATPPTPLRDTPDSRAPASDRGEPPAGATPGGPGMRQR